METVISELKPCPFCGDKDIGMEKRSEEEYVLRDGAFKRSTVSERYQIKCRNCPCGTYFAFYVEDAIDAWNRRAYEVVRCKECKHFKPIPGYTHVDGFCCYGGIRRVAKKETGYCNLGERRERK